jgi:hypothetical protein
LGVSHTMPVEVQQYGNDPILLVTVQGDVSVADVRGMYQKSAALCADSEWPQFWRIIDISQSNIAFNDVMTLVKTLNPNVPGCFSDTRIRTIFAPSHPMARLTSDMLSKPQYGAIDTLVMPGLGEALIYVQDEIERFLATTSGR